MTTDREAFCAGLEHLAAILRDNPDLPLPYDGADTALSWILIDDDDQKALLREFARVIPGTVQKRQRGNAFDLIGTIDGLKVQMIADRDTVCRRVVTGTETVTRTIKDPEALAAVPLIETTETVEIVEWVCEPLLADSTAAA